MSKNILIINSSKENGQLIWHFFNELKQNNYLFYLLLSNPEYINIFKENNWPTKKNFFGPYLKNNFYLIIFFLLWLPLCIATFIKLINYKFNKKIEIIICLSFNEKIIVTPLARILGLKTFWLEFPNNNYKLIKPIFIFYRFFSRWSNLIVFNSQTQKKLINLGVNEAKIKIIQLGMKIDQYQDNLFNKLAQTDWQGLRRKYFTIGTITDLSQKQKIETIFQSIKICLSVIPNLQLIIIGEGDEKKNLTWLAKKMEIDNIVWFVGKQNQLKKWLCNFDIFIITTDSLSLDDYGNVLEAMAAGLPIVAPKNIGLEDIILENKTGVFFELANYEMLAHKIILLQQNKNIRMELGNNSHDKINKYFSIDRMAEEFRKILI